MHTFHASYVQLLCSNSLKMGVLTLRDSQEHVYSPVEWFRKYHTRQLKVKNIKFHQQWQKKIKNKINK